MSLEINKLFTVKDRVVLVTGGGKGVGEMIAAGFVSNGAKVYIASRDGKSCEVTAKALTARGPGVCIPLQADLSKYDDCIRLAKEMEKREEVLNVLVNNSGANWGAPLADYPDSAFTKLLTLNVQRVFTLTQALLPMIEKGGKRDACGRIINIGSINGVSVPSLETFAYSSSKAALHQLTRHLALFVDGSVTVNALACGPFRSKMMAAVLEAGEEAIASALPSNRIGTPQDVAAACIWLASPGGEWITGAIIPVDGGSLVGGGGKL